MGFKSFIGSLMLNDIAFYGNTVKDSKRYTERVHGWAQNRNQSSGERLTLVGCFQFTWLDIS